MGYKYTNFKIPNCALITGKCLNTSLVVINCPSPPLTIVRENTPANYRSKIAIRPRVGKAHESL